MSFPLKELSLACPAYNEADGIANIVEDWLRYLRNCEGLEDIEIVVCNDGSKDDTGAILDRLARDNKEVRPVHHAVNQGAGAALTTAINGTTKAWVLLIDADGQFPIENVTRLAEALVREQADAAVGVRLGKQDTLFARFGSWSSAALANLTHGSKLRDFNCALKLVSGPLLRAIHLEAAGLNYSTELTSRLVEWRAKLVEVEILHQKRTHGKSSMRALRGAYHRFMFVLYLGLRQWLLRLKVLRRPSLPPAPSGA